MKLAHVIATLTSVVFAVWWATYYWFWEPAALTTFRWVFWISFIGSITLIGGMLLHQWTNLAYFNVIITYLISIILFGFQIWVLVSYLITNSIEIWEVAEIINVIFITNNNWLLPIIGIAFASFALYEARLYSGGECREIVKICKP